MDRVDDGGEAMPGVLAPDPACEVDENAAVDVRHTRALGGRDQEPGWRDAVRDVSPPLGEDALAYALLGGCHGREYDEATRAVKRILPRNAQPGAGAVCHTTRPIGVCDDSRMET